MDNNKNTITNEQFDEIMNVIDENTSQQVKDLRELHEKVESEDNSNYPLEAEVVSTNPNDESIKNFITVNENGFIETDMSIFDVSDEQIEESIEKEFNNSTTKIAVDKYGIDESLIIELIPIINEYRKDDQYPVWSHMSEEMKAYIRKMSLEANGPIDPKYYPKLAKELIATITEEIEDDMNNIDIQKSLDELLNIPNILDLYSEHVNELMNKSILETIEEIKDTEPEKAEQLGRIREEFNYAYTLDRLKEAYDNTTRIRKKVRKDYEKWETYCKDVNYANRKTRFKISDAAQMYGALCHIFEEDPDVGETDIKKFIVLLCMSLENTDMENIISASYVYYLIKNIIVLKFVEEGKTDYSKQLISNIKEVINLIYIKEGEFYDQQRREKSNKKQSKSVRKRISK